MKDKTYKKLADRLEEVYSIEPNNLHYSTLTNVFKLITSQFKFFPFRFIIPISIVTTIILYFIVGVLIVKLVSLLQYGF